VRPLTRIAVTGGPGSGKTSVWQLLATSHSEQVLAVPEVATLLFRHVFPHVQSEPERCAVQRAIFQVQQELEAFYEARRTTEQILLCDRGTPDGGGYWPAGHEAFFAAMGTCWQDQLARYDAVLFLESAAVGGYPIDAGNETRRESPAEAVAIDQRLHAVWAAHPGFVHIPHEPVFAEKMERAQNALRALLSNAQ
jgi:predicted ATPase